MLHLTYLWCDCAPLGFYPNLCSILIPMEEILLNYFHAAGAFSHESSSVVECSPITLWWTSTEHRFHCFQCQTHWIFKMRIALWGDLVPESLYNLPRAPGLVSSRTGGQASGSVLSSGWWGLQFTWPQCLCPFGGLEVTMQISALQLFKTVRWGHPWYSTGTLQNQRHDTRPNIFIIF